MMYREEVLKKLIIHRLMKAFGSTCGEHVLRLKGKGIAYLSLNNKCCICPELEYEDMSDLYDKVVSICKKEGVDTEYGKYCVQYKFRNEVEVDPYDDGLMEDEVECHRFEIESALFDLQDEEDMLKFELDIHIENVKELQKDDNWIIKRVEELELQVSELANMVNHAEQIDGDCSFPFYALEDAQDVLEKYGDSNG